jgi:hypothetical protein
MRARSPRTHTRIYADKEITACTNLHVFASEGAARPKQSGYLEKDDKKRRVNSDSRARTARTPMKKEDKEKGKG